MSTQEQERIADVHPLGNGELTFQGACTYLERQGFHTREKDESTWELTFPGGETKLERKASIILRAELLLSIDIERAEWQRKREATPFICVTCGKDAAHYCGLCDTPLCQEHADMSTTAYLCPSCVEQRKAAHLKMEEQSRLEEAARATQHEILIDGDLPHGYHLKEPIATQSVLYGKSFQVWGRYLFHGTGETEEQAIYSFKCHLVYKLQRFTQEEGTYDDLMVASVYQNLVRDELAYLRSIISPNEERAYGSVGA